MCVTENSAIVLNSGREERGGGQYRKERHDLSGTFVTVTIAPQGRKWVYSSFNRQCFAILATASYPLSTVCIVITEKKENAMMYLIPGNERYLRNKISMFDLTVGEILVKVNSLKDVNQSNFMP